MQNRDTKFLCQQKDNWYINNYTRVSK
ncbi:hypothetical protein MTR67_022129 [Solanum verrucosum]|uniref:Uncharacterized protein n=1 Tax=Solanum verrucosum TaxID=315347 RepID=A0AAF0QZF3_SOLVR|nr:hypothetical protein MTR67_022129 [Solanum verrucosum]